MEECCSEATSQVWRSLPFAVSRNNELGLADQIADGFARAIRDGLYAAGDVLPPIKTLSSMLDVGEITVRGALRRLVNARLVSPRRGIGTVVVGAQGRLNRGRVLVISMNLTGSYCHLVMRTVLCEELLRAGYLPILVTMVPQEDGRCDFSQLDQLLGESVSLNVVFGTSNGVWQHLEERGAQYVVLGDEGRIHVPLETYAALPDFIADCRRNHVRKVLIPFVSINHVGVDLANKIKDAGICATVWNMRVVSGDSSRERMFRTTFRSFCTRLEHGRAWLPDVLFFPDDEMAAAALHALDRAGVRIPEDVGFVSWRARGSAPFCEKRLTCLETDPVSDGRKFAKGILRVLSGKNLPRGLALRSSYVRGETFG